MKRRVVFILLLLVAGAIVNVAVAWGVSVFAGAIPIQEGDYRELSKEAGEHYWKRYAPDAWRSASVMEGNAIESWAFGRADVLVIGLAEEPTELMPPLMGVGHFDSGWPMCALRVQSWTTVENRNEQVETRWGWRLNVAWLPSNTVPLLPQWPGFAINTVFYAAVLWLVFAVPLAWRRRRRVRRGLCPKCAYDLRGRSPPAAPQSDVCPECGAAVPHSGRGFPSPSR